MSNIQNDKYNEAKQEAEEEVKVKQRYCTDQYSHCDEEYCDCDR